MRWLSRPATPKSPKLTMERPSAAITLDFKLSHKGNPDSISTMMLPNDHISKTNGTSLRSSTRMFDSVVNLFAKNDYISGGRYSGVLEANCCWCSTVWPSGFKRKLDPRSIIFKDTIFCYSSSKSIITLSGLRSACTIPILANTPRAWHILPKKSLNRPRLVLSAL